MPSIQDNPPAPTGFTILQDREVTPGMSAFAKEVLVDPALAMFSSTTRSFTETILARVELHPPSPTIAAVHRGVTLYRANASTTRLTVPPPAPAQPAISAVVGQRTRVVGADTAYPATAQLVRDANRVLQAAPAFWGRYFTSANTTGNVEYRHRLEDALLASNGIRVLPIARQTNRVGLSGADGRRDGAANAQDMLQTFGESYLVTRGAEFMIFLDVEGNGRSHLSAEYFAGWAAGLAEASSLVKFLPCVYGIPADVTSWVALTRAEHEFSVQCRGLWLARWVENVEPVAWDDAKIRASSAQKAPVLVWQYTSPRDGAAIDRNLVNPAIDPQRDFLDYLIPPPGTPA